MEPRASVLPDLERLHAVMIGIAETAGRIALRDFRPGSRTSAPVHWKDGGSPVTDADMAVDAYLAEALATAAPIAFHSEERPESWRAPADGIAFVIDPIDGTRNFVEGGDAWCIVIGVIENGEPIAGTVHIPARQETFSSWRGGGAYRNGTRIHLDRLHALLPPPSPLRVTGPRTITETLASRLGNAVAHATPVPALAHRLLIPLTGGADLALARAGGHDWDIVASDCILREAGGQLRIFGGETPTYRLEGRDHPPLISGSVAVLDKIAGSLLTDPA